MKSHEDGYRPAIGGDWNVVVTLPERTFREACRLLAKWGSVERTDYYNVLTMKVADPERFLVEFAEAVAQAPGLLNYVSRVVPAQQGFNFEHREDKPPGSYDDWHRHSAAERALADWLAAFGGVASADAEPD